jgi:hypothetical protein
MLLKYHFFMCFWCVCWRKDIDAFLPHFWMFVNNNQEINDIIVNCVVITTEYALRSDEVTRGCQI